MFVTTAQMFAVVYVLEGVDAAPGGATDVAGTLLYRTAFGGGQFVTNANLGYAEAIAVVTMLILAVALGLVQAFYRRRTVDLQ